MPPIYSLVSAYSEHSAATSIDWGMFISPSWRASHWLPPCKFVPPAPEVVCTAKFAYMIKSATPRQKGYNTFILSVHLCNFQRACHEPNAPRLRCQMETRHLARAPDVAGTFHRFAPSRCHQTPNESNPTGMRFAFETGANKTSGRAKKHQARNSSKCQHEICFLKEVYHETEQP
jgi:hypothetical protein